MQLHVQQVPSYQHINYPFQKNFGSGPVIYLLLFRSADPLPVAIRFSLPYLKGFCRERLRASGC
jgi:hypothetical protein